MKLLRGYIANSRGIAAIEMAFIMPFLLFLYFGLVDLTSMISINRKLTYSASVVADLVTQNDSTVTETNIVDYVNAAELIMKPTPITGVRVEVYQFRDNSRHHRKPVAVQDGGRTGLWRHSLDHRHGHTDDRQQ